MYWFPLASGCHVSYNSDCRYHAKIASQPRAVPGGFSKCGFDLKLMTF